MRTVGIIAEYNPFHTGHAYHIRKAKEAAEADYAVIVMSPDFVQRGEPAIFDKYTRAHMALLNGADLVLELPVRYATGSAEYFALGATTLLDRLGVVNTLCFGAENADRDLFDRIAKILIEEPGEYADKLRQALRQGKTFPQARAEALALYLKETTVSGSSELLSSPNNILGIEYCKALLKLRSRIQPIPILREGCHFHSTAFHGEYCSAAAIRDKIFDECAISTLLRYIPENCHALFIDASHAPVTQEELLPFLTQKLLAYDSFDSFFDISSDLSDRIRKLRFNCIDKTYQQIVTILKSRQITEAHIRRALLHLILDIRSADMRIDYSGEATPYVKVLGLRREASPLLHQIKETSTLPFLTKFTNAATLEDNYAKHMWQQDLFASHLYRSIRARQTNGTFHSEYEISPLVV